MIASLSCVSNSSIHSRSARSGLAGRSSCGSRDRLAPGRAAEHGRVELIRPRLEALLTEGQILRYVGRSQSASPATGSYTIHQLEQKRLLSEALSLD
jgi:hypothetical protein